MKKIYITLAVLSLAAIMNTACDNREEEIGEKTELGDNVLAFSLRGVSTRAEVSTIEASDEVNIIPLGTDDQNNNFFLEESVIDLEAPVTRGTPAYSENVRNLYGNEILTFSPQIQNDTFLVKYNSSRGLYMKTFENFVWPVGDDPSLEFYMQMPAEQPENVSSITRANGKITFQYSSPETAAKQQDILFTYRNISKTKYAEKGYVDVLFYHALTGVKFATKNTTTDAVVIKKVEFTGLVDEGTCTVGSRAEKDKNGNDVYVDVTDDYSSADVVAWTQPSTTGTTISSGEYSSTLVDFTGSSFGTKGAFPESFTAAGNTNNLNDSDATQTFWLIPQQLTDNVKLVIHYTINGANETSNGTWTIDFGKALKNPTWKAGQLRTYTITIDNVNVKISDKVTPAGAEDNGYTGSTKTNVVIKNTGNTDSYIRAAIVGQWLDSDGNPVFGFTDKVDSLASVNSWYEDQFVNKNRNQGEFEGLAGYNGTNDGSNGWFLGTDGYYYYKDPVPAGVSIPNDDAPYPLFTKYTVGTSPKPTLSGVNTNVYFVMEIATQAISIYKTDGTKYADWKEAWGASPVTE